MLINYKYCVQYKCFLYAFSSPELRHHEHLGSAEVNLVDLYREEQAMFTSTRTLMAPGQCDKNKQTTVKDFIKIRNDAGFSSCIIWNLYVIFNRLCVVLRGLQTMRVAGLVWCRPHTSRFCPMKVCVSKNWNNPFKMMRICIFTLNRFSLCLPTKIFHRAKSAQCEDGKIWWG